MVFLLIICLCSCFFYLFFPYKRYTFFIILLLCYVSTRCRMEEGLSELKIQSRNFHPSAVEQIEIIPRPTQFTQGSCHRFVRRSSGVVWGELKEKPKKNKKGSIYLPGQ